MSSKVAITFGAFGTIVALGTFYSKPPTAEAPISVRQTQIAQSWIVANGYSCDHVVTIHQSHSYRGYRVLCGQSYVYDVIDTGGIWHVVSSSVSGGS